MSAPVAGFDPFGPPSAQASPSVAAPPTAPAGPLREHLANRRWVRRLTPFPHVVAQNVFTEAFAAALDDHFRWIEKAHPETFRRDMAGYDASGAQLDNFRDGPLGVFVSREWHDLVAGVAGVRATGDVSASVHHHDPGGASGWPHNDLNPGWFGGPPPGPDEIRLPGDTEVDYNHGTRPDGVSARETVRAVSILYYLANDPWQPGDGGETGLYRHCRADALGAAVAPVNNSLVLFECTPYSWHGFLSNRVRARNSVVMWLHRDRAEAVERWGGDAIVHW